MLDDPLKPILEGAEEPTLLPARTIDGDECQRVEVNAARRQRGLLDRSKNVLRRLDYPTDELKKQIAQHEQAPVSEVSLAWRVQGSPPQRAHRGRRLRIRSA